MEIVLFVHVLVIAVIFLVQSQASADYIRHPPRPIIFTKHKRSVSDPQQVHVSLVGKDHMRVSWVISDHQTESKVEYGKSSGKYTSMALGESTKYKYFFYSSGKIHHTKIGPLEPNTVYYYHCSGSGPEFSLKTPPSTLPIKIAIVGDLGQTEWTASTLTHVNAKDYDLLLVPGDLSYADTQQPLWDSFGRFVEPYASHRPWMVTEGNHEVEIFPIVHPQGFKAYNARWLMPYQESESRSNLYYSFDVVADHIIMLGSYTEFDNGSDQYKWLEADLARVDRTLKPWLIVLVHAPWYSTNSAHKGEGNNMRKAMEEMLYKACVDMVFAGHVHAYERFTRIYDKKEDSCAPMYITIGDGGNREGLALMFDNPKPSISLYREASFGHGRLSILNNTYAHWSWYRNNDADAIVADEVSLQSLSSSKACMESTKNQQPFQSTSSKEEL